MGPDVTTFWKDSDVTLNTREDIEEYRIDVESKSGNMLGEIWGRRPQKVHLG